MAKKSERLLQNRARRFMAERVGFLATTVEYLQIEGQKLPKPLKQKIGDAIGVVK